MSGDNNVTDTDVIELSSSELGTKEYWNKTYSLEIRNYDNHGDVGEVWFGEDSGLRVVQWLCSSDLVKKNDKIVDLGCGNGMLLIELAREGFTDLIGVDYSPNAIELAKSVAKSQDLPIKYQLCDILAAEYITHGEYAIALDKGTYDAISLNPDDSKEKRERYIKNVWNSLEADGLLVITSCNWTMQELLVHFQPKFSLLQTIPTPSFQFGGKTGNLITSIVLQKTTL